MQNILEKAYQTLAGENLKGIDINNNPHHHPHHHQGNIINIPQDFNSIPLNNNNNNNFPSSFQELNIFGGGGSDHHHHHQLDLHNNENSNNNNLCLGLKNKRPLIWNNNEDLRLHQDLGITVSSCIDHNDHINNPFKESSMDRSGSENNISSIDPMSEIYDTKPLLQGGDTTIGDSNNNNNNKNSNKFDPSSAKLERPSPRRAPPTLQQADQRMSPMISTGGTPF